MAEERKTGEEKSGSEVDAGSGSRARAKAKVANQSESAVDAEAEAEAAADPAPAALSSLAAATSAGTSVTSKTVGSDADREKLLELYLNKNSDFRQFVQEMMQVVETEE